MTVVDKTACTAVLVVLIYLAGLGLWSGVKQWSSERDELVIMETIRTADELQFTWQCTGFLPSADLERERQIVMQVKHLK